MGVSQKTRVHIWAAAGGRCSFTACGRKLVEDATTSDDESLIGDIAHIVAESPEGPRGASSLSLQERDKYPNLILLCKTHHKVVDDQENTYTVEVLQQMKLAHERRVRAPWPERLWNVPFPHRRVFTGRADCLERMATLLNAGSSECRAVALFGVAGVGKTRTAIEYAHKNRSAYRVVWWIRAEQEATLVSDLAMLAEHLGLQDLTKSSLPNVLDALNNWFLINQNWLLIFDNARKVSEIEQYIVSGRGHIVITSTNPEWGSLAEPLELPPLSDDAAIDFFIKRLGAQSTSVTTMATVRRIALLLGNLPLALEQAAAYVLQTQCSLESYAARFTEDPRIRATGQPSDYRASVGTAWNFSLDVVGHSDPEALALLSLCAYFAPDDIPLDLIQSCIAELPSTIRSMISDGTQFDLATARLREWSLIERSDESLWVHRLVQTAVRERLTPDLRIQWASVAVQIVHHGFPKDPNDRSTWENAARFLGHAMSLIDHIEHLRLCSIEAAELIESVFIYCHERAQAPEAEALHRYTGDGLISRTFDTLVRIEEIIRIAGGFPNPRVQGYFADILRLEDHYAESLKLYSRALNSAPADDIVRVELLLGRANVQKTIQEYDAAETDLSEALRLSEGRFDLDVLRASSWFVLGNVLFAQSKWNDAFEAYQQSVKLLAPVSLSRETLKVRLSALKGIGDIMIKQGHYEDAANLMQESITVFEANRHVGISKLVEAKLVQGFADTRRMQMVQRYRATNMVDFDLAVEAEDLYTRAVQLYRELKVPLGEGLTLYKRAELIVFSRGLADATVGFEQAKQVILLCQNNLLSLCKCEFALAKIDLVSDRADPALLVQLQNICATFRDRCRSQYWEAEALLAQSACLLRLGESEQAERALQRATSIYLALPRLDKVDICVEISSGRYAAKHAFLE